MRSDFSLNNIVVVVLTLKTVLTSIQYILFLTQGKETNFRGDRLTQLRCRKNIYKKKTQRQQSQHLRKDDTGS